MNISSFSLSILVAVVNSSIIGLIGLGLLPERLFAKSKNVMMSPVLGFAAIVIVASNTGLVTGTSHPLIVGPIVTFIVARGIRTVVRTWGSTWPTILLLASGMLLCATLGSLPKLQTSRYMSLQHPSTNHDAFFYSSNQAWVAHHPYSSRPTVSPNADVSSDAPGFSSAMVVRDFNVRDGDALVGSVLQSLTGLDPTTTWYSSRIAWLWIAFTSMSAAAVALGVRHYWAFSVGVGAAASWQALFQLYNQNTPAILGFGFVALCGALAFEHARSDNHETSSMVFLALVVACLITTYSELAPFAGLAIASAAGARMFSHPKTFLRLAGAGVCGALIVPYATFQMIRTIVRVSTLSNALGTPVFWARRGPEMLGDVFGLSRTLVVRDNVSIGIALLVGAGLLAMTLKLKTVLPIVLSCAVLALWIRLGQRGAYYSVDRLVQTMSPVLLWMALSGLALSASQRKRNGVPATLFALSLVGISFLAPINYLSETKSLDWRATDSRAFSLAEEPAVMGDGSNLMVHSINYVDRLWLTNKMSNRARTEYAFLTPDYFYSNNEFDDREADQMLLSNLPPAGTKFETIDQSGGYALYDMSKSTAVLVAPVRQDETANTDGSISGLGNCEAKLLVWSPNTANVVLHLRGLNTESLTIDGLVVKGSEVRLSPGSHTVQSLGQTQSSLEWNFAADISSSR